MMLFCDLYRWFKVVYEYTKAGKSLTDTDGFKASMKSAPVEYKNLDIYGKVHVLKYYH